MSDTVVVVERSEPEVVEVLARGPQGLQGIPGVDGLDGADGVDGVDGPAGPKGDTGAAGAAGAQGPKGDTGATGPEPTAMPESGVVGLVADLDYLSNPGLNAKEWWALTFPGVAFNTVLMGAGASGLVRFVPRRDITARGLSFVTTIAATNNDNCAVAILNAEAKAVLAGSGSVAGKLNATAGRQDVDFTEDIVLKAGTIYYASVQQGTVGGTAATFAAFALNNTPVSQILGTSVPNVMLASMAATFPFATFPVTVAQNARPFLIVRER